MQELSHFSALQQIKKADLPSRVLNEIFPVFEQVLSKEPHAMIGVSSGVDSMTLACLLILRGYEKKFPLQQLHILHCNHRIRPQSTQEADYITSFFHSLPVQIFERPEETKTTEQSLRKRRYECFNQYTTTLHTPSALLLLGHHLEDRIESSFLNAIRGAGLKGFLNMQLLQSHPLLTATSVCRPLLQVTKPQLIAFCQQFRIRYFEDATNNELTTSQRNFIRHEIIEKLTAIKSGTNKFLESMKTVYNEITAYELPNLPNTSPHPKLFTLLPIATSPARNAQYAYRLPFMKGEKEGFSSATLLSLWNMLGIANNLSSSQLQERTKRLTTSSSGRKQKQGVYFFRHQHQLTIIKPHSPASAQPFWKHSLTEETIIKKCGLQTFAGITLDVNEERLVGATLRFPRAGDTFHGKTRNRRCLNQKIPLFWRNFIPVAVRNGNIIHMRKEVMEQLLDSSASPQNDLKCVHHTKSF